MSTHSIRAVARQKVPTVADSIIARIKNVYSRETAQQDGIYYWPEPLPLPDILVPDPLILFKPYRNSGAAVSSREDEQQEERLVLLPATAQATLQARERANFLGTLLAEQGQAMLQKDIPLQVPIGLVDIPDEQKQVSFCVDLHGATGALSGGPLLIAGSPGSGKASALQTLLFWLVTRYSSRHLRCIVLDPDHDLDMFQHLAHFQDDNGTSLLINGEDENDLTEAIEYFKTMLTQRRQRYPNMRWHEPSIAQLRDKGESVPYLLLVVSNYQSFAARSYMLGEALKQLVTVWADAHYLGTYTVVTSSELGGHGIPFDLIPRMGTRIGLFFSDDQQRYSLFGKQSPATEIAPGRGLILLRNRSMYEIQLALPVTGANEKVRTETLKRELAKRTT